MDIKHNLIITALLTTAIALQTHATYALPSTMVYMEDDYFTPQTIIIPAGSKVIWVNKGQKAHDISSHSGGFATGRIPPGGRFSHTFAKPGTYSYRCTIHSFFFMGMTGKVIVK